jgi:hypothetical protein
MLENVVISTFINIVYRYVVSKELYFKPMIIVFLKHSSHVNLCIVSFSVIIFIIYFLIFIIYFLNKNIVFKNIFDHLV